MCADTPAPLHMSAYVWRHTRVSAAGCTPGHPCNSRGCAAHGRLCVQTRPRLRARTPMCSCAYVPGWLAAQPRRSIGTDQGVLLPTSDTRPAAIPPCPGPGGWESAVPAFTGGRRSDTGLRLHDHRGPSKGAYVHEWTLWHKRIFSVLRQTQDSGGTGTAPTHGGAAQRLSGAVLFGQIPQLMVHGCRQVPGPAHSTASR